MDAVGLVLLAVGGLLLYQRHRALALPPAPYAPGAVGPVAPSVAPSLVTGTQSQARCMAYADGAIGAMLAVNPNLRQQMSDWQGARLLRGEDAWDWTAFRAHARGIGAPDPGGSAPVDFCAFAPRVV